MTGVIGIDEVGRGSWAGPLVLCAAILTRPIAGLKDSKLLSSVQRNTLFEQLQLAANFGLGWVSAAEIDAHGLSWALREGAARALIDLGDNKSPIIVDGAVNFLSTNPRATSVIKADLTVPAVSAASIIAKVTRDAYMHELHLRLPAYGFNKHVGYGTTYHRQALQIHGPTPQHRRSFRPMRELGL